VLRTVSLCALVAVVVLAGCGGDDDEPAAEERAALSDSLGFLATDLDLTEDEVACTADAIEERLDGEDLETFAEQVRRVDSGEVALADLPGDASETLTGALTSCAGSS
jgi:hypothetical protein